MVAAPSTPPTADGATAASAGAAGGSDRRRVIITITISPSRCLLEGEAAEGKEGRGVAEGKPRLPPVSASAHVEIHCPPSQSGG